MVAAAVSPAAAVAGPAVTVTGPAGDRSHSALMDARVRSAAPLAVLVRCTVVLGAAVAVAGVVVALSRAPGVVTILSAVLAVASVSVTVVAGAILRADPRNPAGWILWATGATLPVAVTGYVWSQAVFVHGADLPAGTWAGWLDGVPWVPALGLLPTVGLLLLPDGRLPSTRWRPVLWTGWAVAGMLTTSLLFGPRLLDYPGRANPTALPGAAGAVAGGLFGAILFVAPLATLGAVSVHRRAGRARLAGDGDARALALLRLPAWAIAGSWWSCVAITAAGGGDAVALPVEEIGLVALVVAALVAIRRFGLVDARVVVNRTVVYGALTVVVLGTYLLAGAALSRVAAAAVSGPVAVLVALAVALPLRTGLQRLANSLVYGDRDDPLAALAVLGRRLDAAAAPAEVLPGAARAIRDALRLPYVVIEVHARAVAVAGHATGDREVPFPLVFLGEPVGRLVVSPRAGSERFTPAERSLLVGIGRQVAAAVHAVGLTGDLLRSRERVVAVAEDERRRLRRDLHDGLGPALAGVVLGISRTERLLVDDPAAALAQLDSLRAQTQQAVAEIRRLVDGLRPPALDELGLVGALREQAVALGIAVDGPTGLAALPAAVEVAVYRIAVEAMTNTVRHARASSATVTVAVDTAVRLDVLDDGVGLPDGHRTGVGLVSMRERAVELGGTCTVERCGPRGTLVQAVIPLTRP